MSSFVPKKKQVAGNSQQPNQTHNTSAQTSSNTSSQPDDLIVVARIGVAYGVKGWVKIHPFSHSPDALIHAKRWWIAPYIPNQKADSIAWQPVLPTQIKPHSDTWVAHCSTWLSRTEAENIKGWQVAVARSDFPEPDADEFYWTDLMGAQVRNQDGVLLGEVYGLIENAAHTVMQIANSTNSASSQITSDGNQTAAAKTEYLIPFVSAFVGDVDVHANPKTIAVTWDVDATA